MTADLRTAFARMCMENYARVSGSQFTAGETEHLHAFFSRDLQATIKLAALHITIEDVQHWGLLGVLSAPQS